MLVQKAIYNSSVFQILQPVSPIWESTTPRGTWISNFKFKNLRVQNVLTVAFVSMQSSQNLLAENLLLSANVQPPMTHCPTPIIPAAEWYSGSEE